MNNLRLEAPPEELESCDPVPAIEGPALRDAEVAEDSAMVELILREYRPRSEEEIRQAHVANLLGDQSAPRNGASYFVPTPLMGYNGLNE